MIGHPATWTRVCLGFWLAVVGCGAVPQAGAEAVLPTLRVEGRHLVDPAGNAVLLRGVNLGNWFLLESWMLELDTAEVPDHHTFVTTLTERFGEDEARRLMDVHYAHWFTAEDFDRLRSFGFNAVRLPFHYALIERDEGASPYDFRWLDHAIGLARGAGLYVILDLHGAPGGQSIDQPSGRVGENELWTSPRAQQRMVDLWVALAERYGDEPTVAAYDVINEPWGDLKQDMRGHLIALMSRVVPAIRAVDADTLIYLPGTLQGVTFYGEPADRGWTNTGFTDHFYPGLFSDVTALSSHLQLLGPTAEAKQRFFAAVDAPMLVGEFNVVFDHVGGAALMRATYDRYAELGWSATMWSAKRLLSSPSADADGWALITNAAPLEPIDVFGDTRETLENKLISYGTMEVRLHERLREALTAEEAPARFPIDRQAEQPSPSQDALPAPWLADDIGDATPGGQRIEASRWTVIAGGADIFGTADAFRFVSRPLPEGQRWLAWTVLETFDADDRYAKAGWMVRGSSAADAAHALLHVFPDGTLVIAERDEAGGTTREKKLGVTRMPAGLAVQREGATLRFAATDADGRWRVLAERDAAWLDDQAEPGPRLGLATLAHDALRLTDATYVQPSVEIDGEVSDLPQVKSDDPVGPTVAVANASFERADGWHTWGNAIALGHAGASRDGERVLRYAADDAPDEAGAWQDVSEGVSFGDRLTARAWVRFDPAASATNANGAGGVELRLESPPLRDGGPWITLGTATLNADASLGAAGGWLPIRVTGRALGGTVRVLVRASGATTVHVDAVSLTGTED